MTAETTRKSDEIIRKALAGALAAHRIRIDGPNLKNLADAFTARLLDSGVDMDDVDEIVAQGDPSLIDAD